MKIDIFVAVAQREIECLRSQLSLSTEREERYRKALEEITKLNTEGVTKASIIARTALNEGKEKG